MLHLSFGRRLILIVSALLAASAILAVALTPALSDQVRPMLQSFGIISCTSTGPCQEGKNTGTGPGLEGISAKGSGVIGQTTSSGSHAGVLGQDKSTSPNEAGVKGTSTNGAGVIGQSTNGTGMISSSTTSDGLVSRTFRNSTQTFSGASGVFGGDGSNDGGHLNAGVTGSSFNGIGVEGISENWVGVSAVGGVFTGSDTFPALSIVGTLTGDTINDLIDACQAGAANPCSAGVNSQVLRVDQSGDIQAQGIVSAKAFEVCCATSATSTRRVRTYVAQSSQPTLEDYGEAQLVDGQAFVRLSSDFANAVEQHAKYLVVVTPEGPSRGIYVTNKTAAGFAVMENPGGHSTLAFSYRIIARPFDSHGAHLPTVPRLRDNHLIHGPPHP